MIAADAENFQLKTEIIRMCREYEDNKRLLLKLTTELTVQELTSAVTMK
ncbi:MAG: hypothetical protein P4M11_10945 [Candidatus Pacebacteria bacterium]|nr:hypothetical protein [Candidatus Paceibacterota bacterium]